MKTTVAVCLMLVVTVFGSSRLKAQEVASVGPPPHYRELVRMSKCRSLSCLNAIWSGLPHGDNTSRIVYFSRHMMIRADVRSANGLLDAIPATEADQFLFANFESWHHGVTKDVSDVAVLSRINGMWPRLVARAALLSRDPNKMRLYVGYLALAANDIHSDFTGNAQLVCRKQPSLFRKAFSELSISDQKYIHSKVFDVNECKAIFLSEAE